MPDNDVEGGSKDLVAALNRIEEALQCIIWILIMALLFAFILIPLVHFGFPYY